MGFGDLQAIARHKLRVRLMAVSVLCVRRCRGRVDPRQALERHSWGGITLHARWAMLARRPSKANLAKHSLSLRQPFHFPLRVRVGFPAGRALRNQQSSEQNSLGMVFPKGDPSGSPQFRPYDTTLYPPVPRTATPGRHLWVVVGSGLLGPTRVASPAAGLRSGVRHIASAA